MATAVNNEAVHETDERTKTPFLHRVRIRGYKSIAFCDVGLQPLTILVGRNAAGKSNFLDALAFLRDVMTVGVLEAVKIKPRSGWPSLLCRSCDSPKMEIHIGTKFTCGRPFERITDNSGSPAAQLPQNGPWADLAGVAFTATYSLEFSAGPHSVPVIGKEVLELEDESRQLSAGFEVQNGIIQRWRSGPLQMPHSVELLRIHQPDFPLLAVIGMQPFVDLGESLRWMGFYNFIPDAMRPLSTLTGGSLLTKHGENLASVIESLQEIEPDSLERVGEYLTLIAQEIKGFEVFRHESYATVRFWVRGDRVEKTLTFDAASMSDGTLRALAALMAGFQVVLPHGYPSVVGIEEPETALHPAAMQALVDALDDATQRTQVLLTTHSADLLSGRYVNPGQVLVVRNRGGQTCITPVDGASREIVANELYTLADLQRMDKLDLDEADLARQALLR